MADQTHTQQSLPTEVVNVVGCGTLNAQVDVTTVADDLTAFDTVTGQPADGNLLARTDTALAIVWNSGSYTVRGVDSIPACHAIDERLRNALGDLDPSLVANAGPFDVRNVVVVSDIDQPINLSAANIGLGLNNTEYEPEQFPGLIWRTDTATLIVFATGRIVSVGAPSVDTAVDAIHDLLAELDGAGLTIQDGDSDE